MSFKYETNKLMAFLLFGYRQSSKLKYFVASLKHDNSFLLTKSYNILINIYTHYTERNYKTFSFKKII